MGKPKICGNCVHFLPNPEQTGSNGAESNQSGMCRRFPPTPMIMQQNPSGLVKPGRAQPIGMAGICPPVTVGFTCGEFKRGGPHLPAGS